MEKILLIAIKVFIFTNITCSIITASRVTKDYRVIVEDVDHIHNTKKAERDTNNKIAEGVCPKCGGKLVMRNGKYGKFWGCTNYPRCTFTLK